MKRILILEDNVKTLTSLEKMIREISPEIITFPVQTYEEACICAVKQQIDIFILDIILNTKQPGDTSCRLPSKTAICAMFGGQCVT